MQSGFILRLTLLCTLMTLVSCTKTVIHEVPVESGSSTNPSAAATNTTEQVTQDDATTSSNATAAEENPAESTVDLASTSYADIYPAQTVGNPGENVDCENLLPCRWLSTESAFAVTIGSVDNVGSLQQLTVSYVINTLHDTNLLMGNGSDASGASGGLYKLTKISLGSGNGNSPQAVLAGASIHGEFTYDKPATDTSLMSWSITIIDNGLARTALFKNLPIGPDEQLAIDCRSSLPCIWTSAREDITVSLLSAGGFSSNGRLNVNFHAITTREMSIVIDVGSLATGNNGTQFEARTHSLGEEMGFAAISKPVLAGVSVPGNISFFRSPKTPSGLRSLDIVLYEDAPTARWNPMFENLPIQ